MKKILSICLILITLLIFSNGTNAAIFKYRCYGDIDYNHRVDQADVDLIQQALTYTDLAFNSVEKEAADFDHDGKIAIIDATYMQRYILNIPIPEHCGGTFEPMSFVSVLYADYASGKAIVGVPITFTAYQSYPDDNSCFDTRLDPTEYKFLVYSESDSREPIAVRDYSYDNTFTYMFENSNVRYDIKVCSRNKYEFESTYYLRNYKVIDQQDLEQPVITSVYTDKYGNQDNGAISAFKTSCRYDDLKFFVVAKGGCGVYQYEYELKTKDQIITQEYSGRNCFTVESINFPGWDEYKTTLEDASKWFSYNPKSITPYELRISVKDSRGNESSETYYISAISDFNFI